MILFHDCSWHCSPLTQYFLFLAACLLSMILKCCLCHRERSYSMVALCHSGLFILERSVKIFHVLILTAWPNHTASATSRSFERLVIWEPSTDPSYIIMAHQHPEKWKLKWTLDWTARQVKNIIQMKILMKIRMTLINFN